MWVYMGQSVDSLYSTVSSGVGRCIYDELQQLKGSDLLIR